MLARSCFGPPSAIERSDLARCSEQMPCSEQWTVLASSAVNWLKQKGSTHTHKVGKGGDNICRFTDTVFRNLHGISLPVTVRVQAQATLIYIRLVAL